MKSQKSTQNYREKRKLNNLNSDSEDSSSSDNKNNPNNINSDTNPNNPPFDVFVVGSGDCGQLGLGEDVLEKERPAKLKYFDDKNVKTVSCGGMHNIALTFDGKVILLIKIDLFLGLQRSTSIGKNRG